MSSKNANQIEKRAFPSLSVLSQEIGISTGTISRVLNNRPGISEKMRENVLEALRQRGYQVTPKPDRLARVLRSGAGAVAFLTAPDSPTKGFPDVFYTRHMSAMQTVCEERGIYLLLANYEQDRLPTGNLKCVEQGRVIGCVGKHMPGEILRTLLEQQTPVVLYNMSTPFEAVDCVIPNVCQAVHEQLQMLYQLGHRSIACFRVYPGNWQDQLFWSEFRFYGMALELHQPEEFFVPLSFSVGEDEKAVSAFLDRVLNVRTPPTAIVTQDSYAAEIRRQCQQRGLQVPSQMSLIGFDDTSPMIDLCTYRQNFEEMAREALRLILDRAENPHLAARTVAVAGHTVNRGSVAPPPRS